MVEITLKKCFIIHLERASSRRANVGVIRTTLPFDVEVVSAVDAQVTSQPPNSFFGSYQHDILVPRYPNALKPSEIACFQSHRKCWQSILDQDLDAALILEDDVSIDLPAFNRAVNLVLKTITQGDFIRFPYKRREDKGVVLARQDSVVLRLPLEIALGMQAQIVTRNAARELLVKTEIFDRPVDCYIQMRWEHKQRILTIWPAGINEISNEIGGSMINHKSLGFSKVKRELLRPIYRKKISLLSQKTFRNFT